MAIDAATIGGAIGVGIAAFGATLAAAWPIIKKVREVVGTTSPSPAQPAPQAAPISQPQPQLQHHQQFNSLPAYQCPGCEANTDRIEGLEERERETVALLHELIGRMRSSNYGSIGK